VACVLGVVAFFVLLIVGLTRSELRRITPLAFTCQRCGAQFRQPPHRDFPRICPQCRGSDWAV
jgi:Zn finger protein HypA/HybF involved in hydrogenase expression